MTRLYLKIFFGFWCITILMLVGTSLMIHWMDLGPDRHLTQTHRSPPMAPSVRLLREVVRDAVNYELKEITIGLERMPAWAKRVLYITNAQNQDILQRPIPSGMKALLSELSSETPYARHKYQDVIFRGRYLTLQDGTILKVVTLERPGENQMWWRLIFNNLWLPLLISILISGSACFFMAKRLASGIATLRSATRQIAEGDLSVRVAPYLSRSNDEIGDLGKEFDHMTERLQKAMHEQRRLIKDVSHELRSPLARLQIALAIAQQRSNGNVDQELFKIKQAADYLNDVISDILSLPISEAAQWELNDTIDLCSLLNTLTEQYQLQAVEKNVGVNLQSHADEALVSTHGNTLIGVFENILRNAILYTRPDSFIDIALTRVDQQFLIKIKDQGPGVAEKDVKDIFEPFFRTDEARARESGGYGLGLAIAQRTILLHGGEISAYNHPQGGLCIEIKLNQAPDLS